ncbi:uncharacterized protein DSM5745_07022 [Aspergillus mulundensis]|uniref:DUF7730 domain-containing protein n=1 Tax=Aspergillus mulundensis TaxID=1810919 RepID=A0A3D8RK58_9EURO|nr:hypothetical protein DSM5745_07022 [Aspergillus mulundensis]RDW74360.1 hypothetical protein DSM5745_07022 [Aspergillus mulundensis]
MTESLFLRLPPELRLQIYSYILDIPTPYTTLTQHNKPLIVISDTGNKYTTRAIYRSLHISPKWVGISDNGNKNRTLALLSVNRQIHAEVEHFLYTSHTLFFLNGFDLDHLGEFLDTLSPTARRCIRSIGFEVYLFVHNSPGSAKRGFRQYERAAKVVREKLPNLKGVVFYLDPWFSACCDGGLGPWCDETTMIARGVGFLLRVFGGVEHASQNSSRTKGGFEMDLDFLPASATGKVPGLDRGHLRAKNLR